MVLITGSGSPLPYYKKLLDISPSRSRKEGALLSGKRRVMLYVHQMRERERGETETKTKKDENI